MEDVLANNDEAIEKLVDLELKLKPFAHNKTLLTNFKRTIKTREMHLEKIAPLLDTVLHNIKELQGSSDEWYRLNFSELIESSGHNRSIFPLLSYELKSNPHIISRITYTRKDEPSGAKHGLAFKYVTAEEKTALGFQLPAITTSLDSNDIARLEKSYENDQEIPYIDLLIMYDYCKRSGMNTHWTKFEPTMISRLKGMPIYNTLTAIQSFAEKGLLYWHVQHQGKYCLELCHLVNERYSWEKLQDASQQGTIREYQEPKTKTVIRAKVKTLKNADTKRATKTASRRSKTKSEELSATPLLAPVSNENSVSAEVTSIEQQEPIPGENIIADKQETVLSLSLPSTETKDETAPVPSPMPQFPEEDESAAKAEIPPAMDEEPEKPTEIAAKASEETVSQTAEIPDLGRMKATLAEVTAGLRYWENEEKILRSKADTADEAVKNLAATAERASQAEQECNRLAAELDELKQTLQNREAELQRLNQKYEMAASRAATLEETTEKAKNMAEKLTHELVQSCKVTDDALENMRGRITLILGKNSALAEFRNNPIRLVNELSDVALDTRNDIMNSFSASVRDKAANSRKKLSQ